MLAVVRVASLPSRVASLPLGASVERDRPVSFAELVRGHQDEVYGLALRMLGDRQAALDATSSVFLKAYRAFDRFDTRRPARPWLLRIAVNECISAARVAAREKARRAPTEAAIDVADRSPAPEQEALAREERTRVRRAVAGLPELYRVPIVLRYFSELSVDEIATVTGRPRSTVGVQLLRGRAQLRRALEAAP